MLEAVFFDLDGTLVDTAPDFYVVLNQLLRDHGRPEVSYQAVRATVSNGGRALTELGFGLAPGDAGFDERLNELLDAYGGRLAVDTRLFDGMAETLSWLENQGMPWGVITNKPERFTRASQARSRINPTPFRHVERAETPVAQLAQNNTKDGGGDK